MFIVACRLITSGVSGVNFGISCNKQRILQIFAFAAYVSVAGSSYYVHKTIIFQRTWRVAT